MTEAVVLLSGGLDSATVLAVAKAEGFRAHVLTFRYGQRHAAEVEAAGRIAVKMGVASRRVMDIDLRAFGGSALTADIPVPKDRGAAEIGSGIPVTYVPARNTIFLSLALAFAEVAGAFDIFIGVNALDYSGYPDCRPDYIRAFETLANLATRAGVEGQGKDGRRFKVHAPLIALGKADIVRRGLGLGVDYGLTVSCYEAATDLSHCGRCDACLLRRRGFTEAGVADPTRYRA